jgi:pseudaminic acid cytidylyltransferase
VILAVIPARGGSKRIPRKNIRPFCGKPIIVWSIEAARESACFDSIIVSTDDEEIADVARRAGAVVPFMRPAELSDDLTGTATVVRHAIGWCNERGEKPDPVCCIYPTAPFVTGMDLHRGLALLRAEAANFAFPVSRFSAPIQRAVRLDAKGRVAMFNPEYANSRSQDLEPAYHDAGQFYWGTTKAWLSDDVMFGRDSVAIVLPDNRVQDIDAEDDWAQAEAKFRFQREGSN